MNENLSLDSPATNAADNFFYLPSCFSGKWKELFYPKLTRPHPFLVSRDFRVLVPSMQPKGMFHPQHCSRLKSYVLQLPYTCNNTLYLIVPDERGPGATASVPLNKYISTWTQPFPPRWKLHSPRLTLSEGSMLDEMLPLLGTVDIFNASKPSITCVTMQNNLVHIARVFHRAELTVDERGAEQNRRSFETAPLSRVRVFYFNRPFLTVIPGNMNQVLFLGRVMNPADKT